MLVSEKALFATIFSKKVYIVCRYIKANFKCKLKSSSIINNLPHHFAASLLFCYNILWNKNLREVAWFNHNPRVDLKFPGGIITLAMLFVTSRRFRIWYRWRLPPQCFPKFIQEMLNNWTEHVNSWKWAAKNNGKTSLVVDTKINFVIT